MADKLPSLNALKAFDAAARAGSFTRAASELNVTHAAISRHIRDLERDLRCSLFVRTGRGVELTAAGESLLDHARVVIHQIDAMRGDLAGFASGVRASVPAFMANSAERERSR